MATTEEMNNSMTIYYSKSTEEIKKYATGIQDMSIFGIDKDDYSIIWDYVVLPKDEYVLSNVNGFKIDKDLKEVILKDTDKLKKYIKEA